MKQIIEQLYQHETLSTQQAYDLLVAISKEEIEPIQIASVLTVFIMRPIEIQELLGFQKALLDLAIPFDLKGMDALDVCGTGGDRKNSFNISTLAAFVVAGAGFKVVKHGNYGVSSLCGSSNVLEQQGIVFTNEIDTLSKALEEANICFLHAPLFHPAMKAVAPIRRSLAVRTFFNMLGPLVNPANPSRQLTGVFNLDIARKYRSIQSQYDRHFMVIHSLDGYDEVSLTAPAKYFSNLGEGILETEDFGTTWLNPSDIEGGNSIGEAAAIFLSVLNNDCSEAQKKVVLANAALGIHCFDFDRPISSCYDLARESLESGKAKNSFTKMLQILT
jgi:anthranilate phosphoribosyltransferase